MDSLRPPPILRYGLAIGSSSVALLATLLLSPALGDSIFSLFLAAVMISAWYGGLGSGLLATGASALASLFALLPAHFALLLTINTSIRIGVFLFAAILISTLSEARRRSEATAQEERERYAVTLNSIGDGVIVTDRAGRITLMNPIAEALTGWRLADTQGCPISEVFHIVNETTRLPVESPVERTLREGRIVGLANHTLLVARDGTEHPIDDSGAPVRARDGKVTGAVLVFRDITTRRLEEQAREAVLSREQTARNIAEAAEQRAAFLAQASNLLATSLELEETLEKIARLVISAMADLCIVYIRMPDGLIRRAVAVHIDPVREQEIRSLLDVPIDPAGTHPAAQVIRSGQALIDPHVDHTVITALSSDPERQTVLRALTPSAHIVIPLITRGTTIGALSIGRIQRDAHYTAHDLAFAQELAQRAALGIDNARLYEEARIAIQVRDRFLALAAHELRTPLTGAMGNIWMLKKRLAQGDGSSERAQRNLQIANDQLQRLNEMINTLLDVSRMEDGQLHMNYTNVDICALARRIVVQTEDTLSQHTLTCDTPETALIVRGDTVRLEQVLTNLLQNAVKYSPTGNTIFVRVGQQHDRVFLAVKDQGIGIPNTVLPRLFEQFYRAPDAEQRGMSGIGIGLYVVQEIVSLHGGTVQVESEKGMGSTFTVWLPLAESTSTITPTAFAANKTNARQDTQ
ncbi:MAG: PAS domain S-box protein [Oscillochloris sp.]|nr:PAS domain S-box protein [Oscillochloris sp.]